LFGEGEIALRIPSIICWILTAVVLWLVARHLKLHFSWAIIPLALTHPLLFRYGLEVRSYALFYLLASLVIYLFLKKRYFLTALTGVALVYTHLFGLPIVLILLGWAIYKKLPWWWLVIPVAMFLPWLPNVFYWSNLGGALPYRLDWGWLASTLQYLLPPMLILIPFSKKLYRDENFQFLLLLWGLPIIGALAFSAVRSFIFLDRYMIATVPAQLLLLLHIPRPRILKFALVLILIVQVIISYNLFVNPDLSKKPPFSSLAFYVQANRQATDIVLNGSPLTYFEATYYNLNPKIYDPSRVSVPYYIGKVLIPDSDVVVTLPPAKRYWLINLAEGGGSLENPFPATLISTTSFGQLQLNLYEIK
jgi:hypothetical protein